MGNIDSEGSKLRSYFVNDLNASYEIKPKSVFKVIVLSVLVNNILIINISQTDISILMTMITLIHQQLKRLKRAGYYPKRESISCRIDIEVLV
jgi:iron complex outermembrane receptor protein